MRMKMEIITHNEIAGYHCWENAPVTVGFLKFKHRHIFIIECKFPVTDDNRQIEFILQQQLIEAFIRDKYGIPAEFHDMSCEMIAKDILQWFPNASECEIREDGYGGAVVRRSRC